MSSSKLDKDKTLIQESWNSFKSLVRQNLNDLISRQKNIDIDIKRVERIAKIIKVSENDISFLIKHKDIFIELDSDLKSKFTYLEAFQKRNNLDNDLAVQTYNQIRNYDKVIGLLNNLENLKAERENNQARIDDLKDLIDGRDYSQIELISELCETHNIDEDTRKMIFLYPIIKTLKKPTIIKEKTHDVNQDIQQIETIKDGKVSMATVIEDMIITSEESPTVEPALEITEEKSELLNYEDYYNQQKNRYEKLKEATRNLLDKYYTVLSEMKSYETQYYRSFCSVTQDELKTQFVGNYDEANAKILAIKLFDAKVEIENTLISIVNKNYTDKDDIEYLEEYIGEFQSLSDRLKSVDDVLVNKANQLLGLTQSKEFFLTDSINDTFISEKIKKGSLMALIGNAQEGFTSRGEFYNIRQLDTSVDRYKEQVGRPLFSIRNGKNMMSYIKLNSDSNDGGIMILTALPVSEGGLDAIQEATDKIIEANIELLIRQIGLIESHDLEQLTLQSKIRDKFMKRDESFGEGDENEPKTR